VHVLHLGHQVGPAQRDVEDELQPSDGGVDRKLAAFLERSPDTATTEASTERRVICSMR
jgi:hypothetical protein